MLAGIANCPEEASKYSERVYIQEQRIFVEKERICSWRSILDLTKLGAHGGLG